MMVSSESALLRMVWAVVALLGSEAGAEQQAGHADHGVHRRADFVTHVGEKFRLRLVRAFRRFLGQDKFLLNLPTLRDVGRRAPVADQLLAVGGKHGQHRGPPAR